jgi:1,2-diacylglycerol 3-alpha-glucosyltransferase
MKILHCCLANFYIDNYSYQENILPKFHKSFGHNVQILASTESYDSNVKLTYLKPSSYYSKDEIKVTRIPYVNWLPFFIVKKLRIYKGLKNEIIKFKPELIFLHDCQFLSIVTIAKYAKKYKVKIIIDSHTDFVNSGKNWFSKYILHKIIYKFCAKYIEKQTSVFYGTLPLRNDFLKSVYKINPKKIELLPFGIDDSLFDTKMKSDIRKEIRNELNFKQDDFVFVTGGKLDKRKNIHILLEVFNELKKDSKYSKIKLLIFGKPTEEMYLEIEKNINCPNITYLQWINSKEIYKYLLAGDVAVFSGTHSVLWEEAVGLGIPCIFKKWIGIQHLDLGGNCSFIEEVNFKSLKEIIINYYEDQIFFQNQNNIAKKLGPEVFVYSKIAEKSLK